MRQLLLLRHAKSSWDDPGAEDRDRPLNKRGRRAAETMRRVMTELGLAPDLVLVSPARRVIETLDALEPWEETPLTEQIEALYLATAGQILSTLHGVPETVRSVLLIGHNPGMQDLASRLASNPASATDAARRLAQAFPTAALAEFAIAGPWHQLQPAGARLVRFIAPRELPDGRAPD
jgi:phosphohistidine phosphatase